MMRVISVVKFGLRANSYYIFMSLYFNKSLMSRIYEIECKPTIFYKSVEKYPLFRANTKHFNIFSLLFYFIIHNFHYTHNISTKYTDVN